MVSEELKTQIENFISRWLREAQRFGDHNRTEYNEVENVRNTTYVIDRYIDRTLNLEDSDRSQVIEIMERSLDGNRGHGFWERWLWACIGIAKYLLIYNSRNEIDDDKAADVIVRISRWYHTRNNFWIRFRPIAENIVTLIWGNIENLYYMDIIH